MSIQMRRFVTETEKVDFQSPWALEEWLCREDVVPNRDVLLRPAAIIEERHNRCVHPIERSVLRAIADIRPPDMPGPDGAVHLLEEFE